MFENNWVYSNIADDAGAIFLHGAMKIDIINNVFLNNEAQDYSAAVWLREQVRSDLRFEKNVVFQNRAGRGHALETYGGGEGPLANSCIVLENTGEGAYSDAWGMEYSMTSGEDPFVAWDTLDLRLKQGSSAIDAGDPSLPLDSDGTRTDQGVELSRLPAL